LSPAKSQEESVIDFSRQPAGPHTAQASILAEEALTGWAQFWGLYLQGIVDLGRFQTELFRAGLETWAAWPAPAATAPEKTMPFAEMQAGRVAEELARTAAAVGCPPTPLPE
jgi:hypothetical protein